MKYSISFKKIQSNHNRLRDDLIKGWTNELPEIGKPFEMLGPPRDPNMSMRYVTTSPVNSVALLEEDGAVVGAIFNTESGSTYEVRILFHEPVH